MRSINIKKNLQLLAYSLARRIFGFNYLFENLINELSGLELKQKRLCYERLRDCLVEDDLSSNVISSWPDLESVQKEAILAKVKNSLGSDFVIESVITDLSALEGQRKVTEFNKLKHGFGEQFVNETVVSSFKSLGVEAKSQVFKKMEDSFGDRYVRNKVFDSVVNCDVAEKNNFCNRVVNTLGTDFVQEYILERFGALSKESKDLVFPKLIEYIGEPYFKTQVINGIGYFHHGGREKLFNKLYETFGLNYLYQQLSVKFKNNTTSPVPNNDASEVGLNELSKRLLDDAGYLLSPLPIEEQYSVYKLLLPRFSNVFASQEGEDVLIKRLLKEQYHQNGFYVDIGAHDPLRFSTTLHYYLQGWSGINIDPIPGMKHKFDAIRPRDINIECGISQHEGDIAYYMFEESAFNTFSKSNYLSALRKTKLIDTIKVVTKPLSKVLRESLHEGQTITFMTIDVEGFELEVIKSSDWQSFRPKMLCIEALSQGKSDELDKFLSGVNYSKIANTKNSSFFVDDTVANH